MKLRLSFPVIVGIIIVQPTWQAYMLHQSLVSPSKEKGDVVLDSQFFPVEDAVVDVPIPVNIQYYGGYDDPQDFCPRDEVMLAYRTHQCENLLTIGSCKNDEIVLIDPDTKMGFCAPRLCPPDRVFVHRTQLCHDPQDTTVCPGGRELFYSAYGTVVCDCPVGTVESSNSMFDDVCHPILEQSHLCPEGQIYWYQDFFNPPRCRMDPCYRENMKKYSGTLPFVPSKLTGKCHQLGQMYGVCKPGYIYALDLPTLKGVCDKIKNLGYDTFTPKELYFLNQTYGLSTLDNVEKPTDDPQTNGLNLAAVRINDMYASNQPSNAFSVGAQINRYQDGPLPIKEQKYSLNHILSDTGSDFLSSLRFRNLPVPGTLVAHLSILPSGETTSNLHSFPPRSYQRKIRSLDAGDLERNETFSLKDATRPSERNLLLNGALLRVNRQIGRPVGKVNLPYTFPANIFETRLLGCTSRAKRDLNGKCRETLLPSYLPKTRNPNHAPPIPPNPSCPEGQAYNIHRVCDEITSVHNGLVARKLG